MCERRRGYAITHLRPMSKVWRLAIQESWILFCRGASDGFLAKTLRRRIVEPRSFGELRMRGSAEQGAIMRLLVVSTLVARGESDTG